MRVRVNNMWNRRALRKGRPEEIPAFPLEEELAAGNGALGKSVPVDFASPIW